MKPLHALMLLPLAVLAVAGAPAIAQEQARGEQDDARREAMAGTQLSLRQIEARILPRMGDAEYLGPAYDSTARVYRLKFIRNGRVSYVDVDARTGDIIGRSR